MSIFRTHFFVRATFVVIFFCGFFTLFSTNISYGVEFYDPGEASLILFPDNDPNSNPLSADSFWNDTPGGYVPLGDRSAVELSGLGLDDSELAAVGLSTEEIAAVREAEEARSNDDASNDTDVIALNEYAVGQTKLTIYNILIRFGGWVAGLGGNVFDLAFNLFVIELGCLFTTETTGDACKDNASGKFDGRVGGVVDIIWTIIRDLFNIIFIFALVYIGLRLILFSDDSQTKKSIGNLIIAALLVNFSLYIAKLIVDITNFTAASIYTSLSNSITVTQFTTPSFSLTPTSNSIAAAFMDILEIVSFFQRGSDTTNVAELVFAMIAMFFLVFLGIVFLYGAFMILARFIGIVILLVLSPAMFLGLVLPQLSSYSQRWRRMFLAYCFYAPAFVFMIYLSLFTLSQMADALNTSSYKEAIGVNDIKPGSFDIFLLLFLGFGFLFASFKVADVMSKNGAGATLNFAHNVGRKLTYGAATAGAAWTSGRIASWGSGVAGTNIKRAAEAAESYTGKSYAVTRSTMAAGDSLRAKKFYGSTSRKERDDDKTAGDKRAARSKNIKDASSAIAGVTGKGYDKLSEAEQATARVKMQEKVGGMSNSAVLDIAKSKTKQESLLNPLVAGSLTNSQAKAIFDSDEIDDSYKAKFGAARGEAVKNGLTKKGRDSRIEKASTEADKEAIRQDNSNTSYVEGFKSATAKQLDSLDWQKDVVSNAQYIQAGQLDSLKKELGEESEKYKQLEEAHKQAMLDLFANKDFDTIVNSRKGPVEIAKLDKDILQSYGFIEYLKKDGKLTGELLSKIARESKADKRVIGAHLNTLYPNFDAMPKDVSGQLQTPDGRLFGVTPETVRGQQWGDPQV